MSNLFKSSSVISLEEMKRLQWENRYHRESPTGESESQGEADTEEQLDAETISLRDQILGDAEAYAEERMKQTTEQTELMLQEAEAQIEAWWKEKRSEDEHLIEASRLTGFEQGYQEGLQKGEADNQRQWHSTLEDARNLLEQSYRMRESIIHEAEPFLVELSCAIAEKIIHKQLSISPELSIELVRKSLARRREQGVITLCVAPGQLAFVQAAREELTLAIDSQAELQILPDATVRDHGCVIRSSFGSIDARIDTQLEEIKRELLQLALQTEERRSTDEHQAT